MSSIVVHPSIPYLGPIPGGLQEGKRIEIKGSVPYGADVFTVNLASGLDTRSDRPLHLSVRFHGRVVVRNVMQNGSWGAEERTGVFPFIQGGEFTITILVNHICYFISVNGTHCWKFNHRLPLLRVSNILIDGRVHIDRIQYIGSSFNPYEPPQPQVIYPSPAVTPGYVVVGNQHYLPSIGIPTCIVPPPAENPYPYTTPKLNLQPVYNPAIPFSYIIPGGLTPGMMIYISGRPSLLFPNDWTINLQSGTSSFPPPDIAFHFGVRHHNRTVVRNTRVNNVWEWEETAIPHFPFEAGQDFHLLIRIDADRVMVAVDNKHFVQFRHRLQPLSRFEALYIERDVHISSVRFE